MPGRMLLWGIVEQAPEAYTGAQLTAITQDATGTRGDLWVFSTANDIPAVLQVLGLNKKARAPLVLSQSAVNPGR